MREFNLLENYPKPKNPRLVNSKLRTIENYKNGKRHGEFIRYDKNGQTISQSTYKDGTLL